MDASRTMTSVFVETYRSLRRVSDDTSLSAGRLADWPRKHMSRKLEQLHAAYDLLPPSLRDRTWILTSLQPAYCTAPRGRKSVRVR
jgi:hypothetical protein